MSAGGDAVLAIDVGTSGVRAAIVNAAGEVVTSSYRPALPTSPMMNFVEFDPTEQAEAALAVAHEELAGLASFTAWVTLRMATHLVLGERLLGKEGDTTLTVVLTVATVALLSMSGAILGALVAAWDEGRSQ